MNTFVVTLLYKFRCLYYKKTDPFGNNCHWFTGTLKYWNTLKVLCVYVVWMWKPFPPTHRLHSHKQCPRTAMLFMPLTCWFSQTEGSLFVGRKQCVACLVQKHQAFIYLYNMFWWYIWHDEDIQLERLVTEKERRNAQETNTDRY